MPPPEAIGESYDAIPYDSLPLRPTHPSNLAVIAHFAGLEPPPGDECRVLELGCASGGNLIPMAINFPNGTFVGIDLSAAQVADGLRTLRELDLPNVSLQTASIMDVGPELGTFDYVICHGVYSWVPPEVQEKILAVLASNLAPHGLGYVSYNTYPGWHLRGMVRDMLRYHVRGFDAPRQCIEQARAFLTFLVASARDRDSAFAKYLGEEADMLRDTADSYLFHEHLEADNRPCYFHEIVDRARARGLEYLAEAMPSAIKPGEFSEEVEETVRSLAGDVVEFEQYLDFLRNRMFRRTVFCHAARSIDRSLNPDRLDGVHLGSPICVTSPDPDLVSEAVVEFEAPGRTRVSSSHPWLKTAFDLLGREWPNVIPFPVLTARVADALGRPCDDPGAAYLRDALMRCYVSGILESHLHPYRGSAVPGPRPVASPLARLQARTGRRVSTLRHSVLDLADVDRYVLVHLDGTRDRSALTAVMTEAHRRQGLAVPEGVDTLLERCLEAFGRAALLLD